MRFILLRREYARRHIRQRDLYRRKAIARGAMLASYSIRMVQIISPTRSGLVDQKEEGRGIGFFV